MSPYIRTTEIVYQKSAAGPTFVDVVVSDSPTDYIRLTTTVSRKMDTGLFQRRLTAMLTREGILE